MKKLELRGMKSEDNLELTLESTFDSHAELEGELEPMLQALDTYAGDWMPDVVEGKRQRRYSRSAFWKSLAERRDETSAELVLGRTQMPALHLWPLLHFPPLTPELRISLRVQPLSFFSDEKRCHALIELVRAWASHYPVLHATAHSLEDELLTDSPGFGRDQAIWHRDGFDKVYEVSWLNVFGPRLVETVGRERLLSTPAWRVEELPHGAILVVLRPTPTDFAHPSAREAQALAHLHLRPDLDPATLRATLHARSAKLAPIEARFSPDVAPLLLRYMEHVEVDERRRKVSEFNRYQPPEPTEWGPVSSCLPTDVDDPARTLEHYAALAERTVALFSFAPPSVFDGTPESLTGVDYHLWHESFPKVFERERIDTHAVPAVGAYLGEVLVRHLGGEWIPRKNLQESQVRVGHRVWRPFVRAWNALRSCESLLDCSLTQLYRVAERHR